MFPSTGSLLRGVRKFQGNPLSVNVREGGKRDSQGVLGCKAASHKGVKLVCQRAMCLVCSKVLISSLPQSG